jgi:cell division protein FtsL
MAELRNTIISEPEEIASEPKPEAKPKTKKKPSGVKSILEGSFLVREKVIKLLPFLIYLTCIGLLYIFNSNYANRTIISISKTKKQIEEQRYEYINTKSKLMQTTRQTEIAKRLQSNGLKESKTPPRKILIDQANQ